MANGVKNSAAQAKEKAAKTAPAGSNGTSRKLSASEFDAFTAQQGKVVLVDFYADWCGPCKQLAPVLDSVAASSDGKIVIGKINVDEARELAMQHGVRAIPDVRVFQDGRLVDRMEGAISEAELRAKLQPYVAKISDSVVSQSQPVASGNGETEIRTITEAGFESFTSTPNKLVIVDFYADWCEPCRKLSPVLDSTSREFGGVVMVGRLNVDDSRVLARKLGVQGIPDVRFYRDGVEVDKFVGNLPASEIRSKIQKHTSSLRITKSASSTVAPATNGSSQQPAAAQPIAPMPKDWLPPGVQRR